MKTESITDLGFPIILMLNEEIKKVNYSSQPQMF